LRISEPNDAFEQEAERVANEVMAGGQNKLEWSLSKVQIGAPLQRKCPCGGPAGAEEECEECKKKESLQRRAASSATPTVVPSIVHDVLRSSGQPLDGETRGFFEPRFGHDFSKVRIHTDAKAAESAQAVSALAYTVGRDVVFGAGQYAPATSQGRELLGHELTHVVQQSEATASTQAFPVSEPAGVGEQDANRVPDRMKLGTRAKAATPLAQPVQTRPITGLSLSRKVVAGKVHCTPGKHGAPSDPVAELTSADDNAGLFAALAMAFATIESVSVGLAKVTGAPVRPFPAYQARFGLPPAVRGGFMNRLSGKVEAKQEDAIAGELDLLGDRLKLISDKFDADIDYTCTSNCPAGKDAFASFGTSAIGLCPGFWKGSGPQRATLLIHEAAHMIWANVGHGANYTHASCYANFVADLLNAPPTTPECVAQAAPSAPTTPTRAPTRPTP
jgi:hypothetical protein